MKALTRLRQSLLTRSLALIVFASLIAAGSPSLRAVTYYWDTNGATPGSGANGPFTWNTTNTLWTTDSTGSIATIAITSTNADDLFFAAGTNATGGTVTLSGTQAAHSLTIDDAVNFTLSGGTALNLGSATAGSGLFSTANQARNFNSSIVLNSAATALTFSNTGTGLMTVAGTVTGSATSGTQTLTLSQTSNNGSTLLVSGNISDGAAGGNVAVVRSAGNGFVQLTGTNTYTGTTTINAGALFFGKSASLYNGNTANWTAANITVNSGGTIGVNMGGAGQFTDSEVATLIGSDFYTNGGMKAGAFLGFNTTGGNATVSTVITNSAGPGGGSIGIQKIGANTLTISGANTYTGLSVVRAGTLTVQNDQSAANGGWVIGDSTTAPAPALTQLSTPIVNFAAGSTIAVASGKSINISGGNSGASGTLNVAGTVTNDGTLVQGRQGFLTLNSGANWTQNGTMSLATSSSTFGGVSTTINSGATLTYNNTTAIPLIPSTNGSGSATFTVAGGTFVTKAGFTNTGGIGTGTGNSAVVLSGGGTIQLAATVTNLQNTNSTTNVLRLGTGGGIIDTNSFDTAIPVVVSDVSGQTGSLTKNGTGTLTLSGNNTFTGGTTVNAGRLTVSNNNALGTGAVTMNDSLGSGSELRLTNGITTPSANALTISDTGGTKTLSGFGGTNSFTGAITVNETTAGNFELQSGSANTLTISGDISGTGGAGVKKIGTGTVVMTGANTYTGPTTINVGTLQLGDGGTTGSLNTASNISVGTGAAFVVNQSDTVTQGTDFSGSVITGLGSLTQAGSGTTVLNAANTYSGGTTISAGSLEVNNTSGSGTGGGTVTVNTTLKGDGAITAATNNFVYLNGTMQVGQTAATVGQDFSLTTSGTGSTIFGASSILGIDLWSTTGTDMSGTLAAADMLRFFGTVDITAGSSLIFGNPNALTFQAGDVFKVFDWAGLSTRTGTFTPDLSAATLGSGLSWDTSNLYTLGTISVLGIPEPSRALLLLSGLLGLSFRRRRSRL